MNLRPIKTASVFLFLGLLAFPASPRALDLGLTPSHVFSLWLNINNSLIAVSGRVSGDVDLAGTLAAMKARNFSGKNPADVFGQVIIYRDRLDKVLHAQILPRTKKISFDGETITPSDVYLNSGHVLSAQVRWLIVKSGDGQSVSQFYTRYKVVGKTPSDVFALVDLAIRRL
jgi:hypothetical protein